MVFVKNHLELDKNISKPFNHFLKRFKCYGLVIELEGKKAFILYMYIRLLFLYLNPSVIKYHSCISLTKETEPLRLRGNLI